MAFVVDRLGVFDSALLEVLRLGVLNLLGVRNLAVFCALPGVRRTCFPGVRPVALPGVRTQLGLAATLVGAACTTMGQGGTVAFFIDVG